MLQPFESCGVVEGMSKPSPGNVSPEVRSATPAVVTSVSESRRSTRRRERSSGLVVTLLVASLLPANLAVLPAAAAALEATAAANPVSNPKPEAKPDPDSESAGEPTGPTHRYARIPKRNAFGIKPPQAPPPPEPEKEPPKDRPEFFLTGFTTVRGVRRAFVAYQPKGKPLQYPRPLIPDEEVGIADGVLKLVSIDPIEKAVTIAYNGEEIPLNFKDNAVKTTPGAPAPAGTVPSPGAPGLSPSALRGNQPPPPIMNAPAGIPGQGGIGGVPGAAPGGYAPTVIGRGGAILSGGGGAGMLQATPFNANAIPAGGTAAHGGIDVPAVAPSADQLGGTVPVPVTRIGRVVPPPPPAPFPGLPGQ